MIRWPHGTVDRTQRPGRSIKVFEWTVGPVGLKAPGSPRGVGCAWIRQQYHRAAVTGDDVSRTAGLLVLSRLPLSHVVYVHLPPSVGRGLLQAKLTINGRTLAICSLHPESGKTASKLRARQLDRVFRAVKTAEDVMLLGDFNLRNAEHIHAPDPLYRRVTGTAPERRRIHRRHLH